MIYEMPIESLAVLELDQLRNRGWAGKRQLKEVASVKTVCQAFVVEVPHHVEVQLGTSWRMVEERKHEALDARRMRTRDARHSGRAALFDQSAVSRSDHVQFASAKRPRSLMPTRRDSRAIRPLFLTLIPPPRTVLLCQTAGERTPAAQQRMILPDDTPESPAKTRAGLPGSSESVDEDFVAPPPAYPGPASSSQPSDLEAQMGTHQVPNSYPERHGERRERAPKRFLRALGIAVLIWVAIGLFARNAFTSGHWRISPFPGGRMGDDHDRHRHGTPQPHPIDGKVERCVRASSLLQYRNSRAESVVSFELPISADALYIFGRGALSRGSINFMPVEGDPPTSGVVDEKVKVDITTTYEARFALDAVNFCLLERLPGQHGIGILTPSEEDHDLDLLDFKIDHTMRDLKGVVEFESISLASRNMPLLIEYLAAEEATLATSNAMITGTYNVSRTLFLKTSNQNIDADVTLVNPQYYKDSNKGFTNLTILNANGAIDTRLSLFLESRLTQVGGDYDVVVHTDNARISLPISYMPPFSKLLLDAKTSNAPASVELPLIYAGDVEARTTNSPADVECDPDAQDPLMRGNQHLCKLTQKRPEWVKGFMGWGSEQ
ncbi:hypothetical protein ACG7TL_008519 [Trametes sanguinea]